MARWQHKVRLLLAVFTVVFGAAVYFAVRERPAPVAGGQVQPSDPNAVVESTGAVATQEKGATDAFRLESRRHITYADGSMKLEEVKISIPDKGGRTFVITGREADVGKTQSAFTLRGDVKLTASDGLTAATDRASYDDQQGVVQAPGPVSFARGQLSGSGVGATYDRARDTLMVHKDARATVAAQGAPPSEITSGSATLARREKLVRFEGGARILRSGRTIEADTATAYLTDDEQRVKLLELRGQSRISGGGTDASFQAMRANDINLSYADDGQSLRHADLMGNAVIELAGSGGQAGRQISADSIDVELGPDGATPVGLTAHGRVQVDFAAEQAAPARRIQAPVLDARGSAGQGLTAAQFSGGAEYRELRGGATPESVATERLARAQTLDLALKPGFTSIDEARFSHDVRFTEGQLSAQAPDARYRVSDGVIELPADASAGSGPVRVSDESATIDARRIVLTLDGRKMTADDTVRSELKAGRPRASHARPSGDRAAQPGGLLKQGQPVYVTADHLVYDGGAAHAIYTGHARLWQGETSVQGSSIEIDDRVGNLRVKGSARGTFIIEQVNDKTKAKEKVNTVGSAEEIHYDDSVRRVSYLRKAHLNGPPGDLTGDRIELFLDAAGREIDRAEAYDTVMLKSGERAARGDRMTYFAADERYVMSGSPVRIVQQIERECRETTGKTLTFFKSTDTITVDGNEETRTQTRTGVKCSELRLE